MNFYPLAFLLLFTVSSATLFVNNRPSQNEMAGTAKIVFKSIDGGQTWQNISTGLPDNLRKNGIRGDSIFTNDKGLFVRVGTDLYHHTDNAGAPLWIKEILPNENSTITPNKSGVFAYNYWGVHLKTANGKSVWSPLFDNAFEPRIRSTFETAGGSIFLGTNLGIFKTTNSGKTWKHVYTGAYVGHLAELNGVLVAIGMRKIIRSTDDGETWSLVSGEGMVAFDVKQIRDGFVAITATSVTGTRTLSISHDAGTTWQPIDMGIQNKALVDSIGRTWNDRQRLKAVLTSITQIGENLFCTHPDGIFKSSDKGKTWKLLLPSVEGKFFNVFGSGKVIYAIPSKGRC